MNKAETAVVRMVSGTIREMAVCGRAPSHKGKSTIVVTNGEGCFAACLTPSGWVVIDEPVRLFPVT